MLTMSSTGGWQLLDSETIKENKLVVRPEEIRVMAGLEISVAVGVWWFGGGVVLVVMRDADGGEGCWWECDRGGEG